MKNPDFAKSATSVNIDPGNPVGNEETKPRQPEEIFWSFFSREQICSEPFDGAGLQWCQTGIEQDKRTIR